MNGDDALSLERLQSLVGQELGVSDWVTITQAMIDEFAALTLDQQWIHVDRERAIRESPLGTTIAHGFLTLSLIPGLRRPMSIVPDGITRTINYGIDYLRFIAPVRSNARIRLHVVLTKMDERPDRSILLASRNVIELEGGDKPALVADMLTLLIP